MRVLITGATGFVGGALCTELLRGEHTVRATLRHDDQRSLLAPGVEGMVVGPLASTTDWSGALSHVDVVIHLAALAHAMGPHRATAQEIDRINHLATAALASQAATAGVRRLIFLSSVKVNGESTLDRPFCESDPPSPEDAYGIAKWHAEQALARLKDKLEVVVLRPPLVYGPGVKGNLLRLMDTIAGRRPLPLASIVNRRSLLGLDNLVSALMACASHPAAAGRTYLLSDGIDLSTPGLIRQIAHAMNQPARLFPFPVALLKWAGALSGNAAAVARLTGSLQIDSGRIRRELGWTPTSSPAAGLARMGEWYDRQLRHRRKN